MKRNRTFLTWMTTAFMAVFIGLLFCGNLQAQTYRYEKVANNAAAIKAAIGNEATFVIVSSTKNNEKYYAWGDTSNASSNRKISGVEISAPNGNFLADDLSLATSSNYKLVHEVTFKKHATYDSAYAIYIPLRNMYIYGGNDKININSSAKYEWYIIDSTISEGFTIPQIRSTYAKTDGTKTRLMFSRTSNWFSNILETSGPTKEDEVANNNYAYLTLYKKTEVVGDDPKLTVPAKVEETFLTTAKTTFEKTINFTAANLDKVTTITTKSKTADATPVILVTPTEIAAATASGTLTLKVDGTKILDTKDSLYQDTIIFTYDGGIIAKTAVKLTVNRPRVPDITVTPATRLVLTKVNLELSCEDYDIYYTTDKSVPTNEESATCKKYSTPIVVSTDTNIKARAYSNDPNVASNETVTDIKFVKKTLTPKSLPFTYSGGKAGYTEENGYCYEELGNDYSSGAYAGFTKNGYSSLYVAFNDRPREVSFGLKGNGVAGSSVFTVAAAKEDGVFTPIATYDATELATFSGVTIKTLALDADYRYLRFDYTKDNGNVQFGPLTVRGRISGTDIAFEPKSAELPKAVVGVPENVSFAVVGGPSVTGTVTVNKLKGGDVFTVPTTLDVDKVKTDAGDVLNVVYTPAAAGKDTAVIEVVCGEKKDTARIYTVAAAPTELANLTAALGEYSKVTANTELEQPYKIAGEVVITNLDSNYFNGNNTLRIWVQDTCINATDGRSLQLYISNPAPKIGYPALRIGDTLRNIYGRLYNNNKNLRLNLIDMPLSVKAHGNKVYVDTIDDIAVLKNSDNITRYSGSLVCVKNVVYEKRSNYTGDTITVAASDNLVQGTNKLTFRTDFRSADYIGDNIPVGKLYVTGILTQYNSTLQITPRNRADMVEAPCLVPQVEVQDIDATTATLAITAEADSFMYKIAESEAELAAATEVKVKTKSVELTGLSEVTTYYYQVKSLCSPTATSEYSEAASFETSSSGAPRITILCPVKHNGQDSTFTDSVTISYTVANAKLGVDDTIVRISFGGKVVDTVYTVDTAYTRFMRTGSYTVKVELMKKDSVTPMEKNISRSASFKVNLPDVAVPAITPNGGRFYDSVVARISCGTTGASVFYSLDGTEPSVAYNVATDSIIIRENSTLKVMAVKEKMDTARSSVVFYINHAPKGLIVFEENFTKVDGSNWNGSDITSALDTWLDNKGWTGTGVYKGPRGVKLGTGGASGTLTTPALDLSADGGKYTIAFYAASWVSQGKKDCDSMAIIVGDTRIREEGLAGVAQAENGLTEHIVNMTGGAKNTKITFSGLTGRIMLDSIRIFQDLPAFIKLGNDVALEGILNGTKQAVVSVRGYKLADTLKIETPRNTHNAFAVAPAYIVKDEANKTNNLTVTYTARTEAGKDTLMVVAKCGALKDTAYVYAQTLPCVSVHDSVITVDAAATGATLNVRGADSLRYQYKAKTATAWSAAANTSANAIVLSGLTAETQYVVRIQRICGKGYYSEPMEKEFTTLSATAKNVILVQPTANQEFTGAVTVKFRPVNFRMGDSGLARVMFSTNDTVYVRDTVCTKVMASGSYTVKVELLGRDSSAFTPAVTAGPVSFRVQLPKAAKPVATPNKADSIYIDSVNVSLATATANAKIYYKLNNASWTEYTRSLKLTVGNHTLKAYAKGELTENSDTLTATYNVKVDIKGVKLFEENFSKAALASDWDKGTKLTAENIAANTDEEGWTLTEGVSGNSVYAGAFGGAKFGAGSNKGSLTTRALDLRKDAGMFYVAFKAASYKSDNSVLTVSTATETKTVNDLPGIQNTDSTLQEVVLVFEDGFDATALTFTFSKRGMLDAIRIYQDTTKPAANRVAMPLFTPAAGDYLDSVKVTLSCATEGASIFYSVDGSEPATAYTAPFMIRQTTTVKAVAKKDGMANSKVASAVYTIKSATPVATLEALYEQTADNTTVYKVTGDLVVSFMDSYNNRVWLQDKGMNDEEGAGMLVFKAANYGYSGLQVGDVIPGLQGTLTVYNGLYEVNPTAVMTASSHDGSVFVCDAKIADLKNANTYLAYQSTLVKLQKVHFLVSEGTLFEKNKTYLVSDGTDTIDFYCTFANADYIGTAIPTGEIYLIGMMGYYNKPQITARSLNDLNGAGVGVAAGADGVAFAIYPNPNNGRFLVNLNEEASIEVYNALGVKVLNRAAATGLNEIKLGSAGVYFVKVICGERSSVKRVIVR